MKTKKKRTAPVVHIGPDKMAIEAVTAAILKVLASPAADAVKATAVEQLAALAETKNTTISGCTIAG